MERNIIEKIYNNTQAIKSVYDKMYNAELTNNINELKKRIEHLKIALEVENEIYKNIEEKKLIEITKIILNDKIPSNYEENIYNSVNQDNKGIVDRRILNTLGYNPLIKGEILKHIDPIEFIAYFAHTLDSITNSKDEKDDLKKGLYTDIEITSEFERDYNTVFLNTLNEYINDKKYKNIKNELLKLKYNLIFTNTKNEADLLTSNLIIPEECYLYSRIFAEYNRIKINEYVFFKNKFYSWRLIKQLEKFLMKDIDTNNILPETLLYLCSIRALLTLIDKKTINDVKGELIDFTSSYSYIRHKEHNNKAEKLVIDAFNEREKEKIKVKTLSIND